MVNYYIEARDCGNYLQYQLFLRIDLLQCWYFRSPSTIFTIIQTTRRHNTKDRHPRMVNKHILISDTEPRYRNVGRPANALTWNTTTISNTDVAVCSYSHEATDFSRQHWWKLAHTYFPKLQLRNNCKRRIPDIFNINLHSKRTDDSTVFFHCVHLLYWKNQFGLWCFSVSWSGPYRHIEISAIE
jgi:hypothetical protein